MNIQKERLLVGSFVIINDFRLLPLIDTSPWVRKDRIIDLELRPIKVVWPQEFALARLAKQSEEFISLVYWIVVIRTHNGSVVSPPLQNPI